MTQRRSAAMPTKAASPRRTVRGNGRPASFPPALAAQALIERQPLSKSLTYREKENAAAILSGEMAAPSVAALDATPIFKAALISALAELDITPLFMAQHAKGGLAATKPYGKDAVHSADWMARHKYFTSVCEMLGVLGGSNDVLSGAMHYRSRLRTDGEIIDVTPPKSDVAKRRMAAVKPNMRKE